MSEINKEDGNENSNAVRELLDVTRDMANGNYRREVGSDLYGELGELARYINMTFKKLQTLEPNIKLSSEKIPMATSQLSDITRATEEATNRIMGLTEKVLDNHDLISSGIERVKGSDRLDKTNIGELDKLVSDNKESLVEIITCLSFQDLTGQKINKIVAMMREVESRILELIVTFGLKANSEKGNMDEVTSPILNELKKPVSDDLKQDLVDDMLKKFGF